MSGETIAADESGQSSLPGVFAAGDSVRGAAAAIHEYLSEEKATAA